MNSEQLNSVFGKMSPSVEQKEKMFAEIMKAKSGGAVAKEKNIVPFRKYALGAVAVLAVSTAAILSYNSLPEDNGKKIDGSDTNSSKVATNYTETTKHNGETPDYIESVSPDAEEIFMTEDSAEPAGMNGDAEEYANAETEFNELSEEEPQDFTHEENKKDFSSQQPQQMTEEEKDANQDDVQMDFAKKENTESIKEIESSDNEVNRNDGVVAVAPESVPIEPDYDSTPDSTKGSGGGYGGGSGGGYGGGSASAGTYLSFEQVMNHGVYSEIVPNRPAVGYSFGYATEASGKLQILYTDISGNRINVTVSKNALANVIGINEIVSQKGKYVSFSLKCGDYYVTYSSNDFNGDEIYKMAASAQYYN